jgi:muramoyltetrapeptide carboxypeptidase LdcA involved in peptidoglycan recycling
MLSGVRPDIPAVLDVDFGHTDPQLVLPHGGAVRISPTTQTIEVLC